MPDTQELKSSLHALIDQADDLRLLEAAHRLVAGGSDDFWDDLTDTQKHAIQSGLNDADAGRTVSWEELKRRLF